MRRILLIPILACAAWAAESLGQVQAVYLLPMGNGLDQYLAQRLTREAVFPVVTDPKLADAVFTDQIGASFERRLSDLYAPVISESKPVEGEKKTQAQLDEEERVLSEQLKREGEFRPPSAFNRGKGNLFLVDVKSKRVIWSTFEPSKNFRAGELEKTCGRITAELRKALGRK